jgi:hypothetical protein
VGQARTMIRRRWAAGWGAALVAVTGTTLALAAPAGANLSAESAAGELAQAHQALLVLSDMPSGWETTKTPNNPSSTVGDAQLARCIGVASSLINESPPTVNSLQFQNKAGTLTVNDAVTVFPSAKNAAAELATVSNRKTPGCMTNLASGPLKQKLFGKTPKGMTYGTALVSATDPTAFPFTAGYSMSVPVLTNGVTVNITVIELFAIKGRLGQQITFTGVGEPFSIPVVQHISAAAVQRL